MIFLSVVTNLSCDGWTCEQPIQCVCVCVCVCVCACVCVCVCVWVWSTHAVTHLAAHGALPASVCSASCMMGMTRIKAEFIASYPYKYRVMPEGQTWQEVVHITSCPLLNIHALQYTNTKWLWQKRLKNNKIYMKTQRCHWNVNKCCRVSYL